ncbi:ExbD/TolR family protein [Thiobaca trueperi]|uniref:Outer membrane transport energization protein ExbD n=1 Tax=Thiobaca trueperi TaxID=127458 RepID=A0A4R3N6C8_9GAMM|nr:biopolymer transporter ExbD [Thiobaca trueperi]TCT24037.1 outer membrane transport energization protein ExbD [Thiobaca trueperi]
MRFIRTRPRAQDDDHLVPLINVIFLMLIFFMIVGRISPAEPLAVEPPVSAQGRDADDQARVLLLSADGRLALDGEILTRETLGAHIADWLASTGGSGASSGATLTLKADATVRAGALRETLDLLRAAGIGKVSLVTTRMDR